MTNQLWIPIVSRFLLIKVNHAVSGLVGPWWNPNFLKFPIISPKKKSTWRNRHVGGFKNWSFSKRQKGWLVEIADIFEYEMSWDGWLAEIDELKFKLTCFVQNHQRAVCFCLFFSCFQQVLGLLGRPQRSAHGHLGHVGTASTARVQVLRGVDGVDGLDGDRIRWKMWKKPWGLKHWGVTRPGKLTKNWDVMVI
jgi:hypothetical protein